MSSVGKRKCLAYEPTTGGKWDFSYQTCGWGNNTYTTEVVAALVKVYQMFVKSTTAHIHEITQKMCKCSVSTSSGANGHHQTCYTTSDQDTFVNVSGFDTFFLVPRRLQRHFPVVRSVVRLLYRMKRYHEHSLALNNILSG